MLGLRVGRGRNAGIDFPRVRTESRELDECAVGVGTVQRSQRVVVHAGLHLMAAEGYRKVIDEIHLPLLVYGGFALSPLWRAAITEGRDAVQGLRSSTAVANELARAITTFGEGLAADQAGPNRPEFRVYVEGKSKNLPPLVRDEVYKVACECLRNAFHHAQAKRIEVRVRYEQRQFWLQIVDNGKGIDPAVLSAGGRTGHHGLPGLHERAKLAGGKLAIWSEINSGTEIELSIPGLIAYLKSPAHAMSAGEESV